MNLNIQCMDAIIISIRREEGKYKTSAFTALLFYPRLQH